MTKDILLEQHNACFDENGWFVSLKSAVDGVTAEQAAWKPAADVSSIRENAAHILFWIDRWLRRHRGELNKPEDVENDSTFLNGDSWDELLAKLDTVMLEWRDRLGSLDEAAHHRVELRQQLVPAVAV